MLTVVVVAACSRGAETADPKKDTATAAKLVLVAKDLPEGFVPRDHRVDEPEKRSDDSLATCLHLPPSSALNDADIHGQDFIRGLGERSQSVRSGAVFAKQPGSVSRATKVARSQLFKDCVKIASTKLFVARSPSVHIDDLRIDDHRFPRFGDATYGYRLQTTVAVSQTSLSVYADVVVYTKGRARVTATFTSIGQPFPAAEELSLAKLLGKRLDQRV